MLDIHFKSSNYLEQRKKTQFKIDYCYLFVDLQLAHKKTILFISLLSQFHQPKWSRLLNVLSLLIVELGLSSGYKGLS